MKARELLLVGVACAAVSATCIAPALADVAGYREEGPAWTHTASACAVDPQQLGKAFENGADFSFLPTAFSDTPPRLRGIYLPLVARCNVVNSLDADPASQNPAWNALIVGYSDPDGAGPSTSVGATLFQVSRDTGNTSTVVTFDSNDHDVTARTEELVQFNQPIDFRHNEYYVELDLIRTPAATRQSPVIYSVRLVWVEEYLF
jgi:hypothetical protein